MISPTIVGAIGYDCERKLAPQFCERKWTERASRAVSYLSCKVVALQALTTRAPIKPFTKPVLMIIGSSIGAINGAIIAGN